MRTFVCEDEPMATQAAHDIPTDPALPLYRLDPDTYTRLVEAGALDGAQVGLRNGLLVDRNSSRGGALHRLDTETYNRMVATGALEDEPVELLDGLLVEMSRQGPSHYAAIMRLTRHLATARAWLGVQGPLEIKPDSEPEPDLALIEGEPSSEHLPRRALLAVEVAVTTHSKDRKAKGPIYARNGVPTYWLVDVPGRTVEVRTEPSSRGYKRREIYKLSDRVPSPAEGVAGLDVAWLFDESPLLHEPPV
jgi:Uma2 family endonuclease